jgi:1,2-diacylglycerol 3-alpha-glucosyltransferase
MKILMVCGFFHLDVQYQENLMAHSFVSKGHDVFVVTSQQVDIFGFYKNQKGEQTNDVKIEKNHGITVHRLPDLLNINGKIRFFKYFLSTLIKIKPDAIFLHDICEHAIAIRWYLYKNPNVRILMDYHCDYSNSCRNSLSKYILHRTIRRSMLMVLLGKIRKVFPVTPTSADFLEENYGLSKTKMELLPLGSNFKVIEQVKKYGKTSIRHQIGIPDDAILIFTGGKFDRRKKLDILIGAFEEIDDEGIYLVICGGFYKDDLEYQRMIEKRISSLPRVRYVGWKVGEELYKYMCASDIGVFAASQSILWQDCIACGLPLIVGDIGGQSIEYLNLKSNIVTLKKDEISSENIRLKIMNIAKNPLLLKKMNDGAKEVGETELNWDILGDRVLKYIT